MFKRKKVDRGIGGHYLTFISFLTPLFSHYTLSLNNNLLTVYKVKFVVHRRLTNLFL